MLTSRTLHDPRVRYFQEYVFDIFLVQGHAGKLVFGRLGGQSCVCMVGRLHLYEGHSLSTTTFPIRIMSLLGVKTLFLTNAAGSLNHDRMKVGNVCVLTDHINIPGMAGNNPLIGPNLDQFGPVIYYSR